MDSNHQSQRERFYRPFGYQLPVTTPFVEAEGLEPPTPYGSGFTSEFLSLLLTYTLCKHFYSIRRVYHFTTLQCFSKNFWAPGWIRTNETRFCRPLPSTTRPQVHFYVFWSPYRIRTCVSLRHAILRPKPLDERTSLQAEQDSNLYLTDWTPYVFPSASFKLSTLYRRALFSICRHARTRTQTWNFGDSNATITPRTYFYNLFSSIYFFNSFFLLGNP